LLINWAAPVEVFSIIFFFVLALAMVTSFFFF